VNASALVVLGNSSARARRRLVTAAERIAPDVRASAVVFSGWSSSGGRSEAEHMRSLWRGPRDVELVVERTASTTTENAVRTLPLLLERGLTQAIVVCAPMHLVRARWIFRSLYERHGVVVRFAAARVAPTPGALLWELGALTVARRQLGAARAELDRA
jgi:uncharacterized SAM-binding protein YcdF (DUF218 family)